MSLLFRTVNKLNPLCLKNKSGFISLINNITTKTLNFEETTEIKKTKKPFIPKITLVSAENVTITTLEDAQKISKRRDLKLVKILDVDAKTQRPVYKLMKGAEYHQEELKQRELKKKEKLNSMKGEKVLILGMNISQHDLSTNVNKVKKWIEKRYEVRVVINGDSNKMEKAESIYNFLETNLKDSARIVQKRQKGNDLKFQIVPPKKEKETL